MTSDSVNESSLCVKCAAWNLDELFEGEAVPGHLRDSWSFDIWDCRPLDQVQRSVNCKLCRFIITIMATSSTWKKVQTAPSKLYLQYEKSDLGYRDTGSGFDRFSALSLKLVDDWDPQKCSSSFSSLDHPQLQRFQPDYSHEDQTSHGLLLGRKIEAQIDFNLVHYWITTCNSHGAD